MVPGIFVAALGDATGPPIHFDLGDHDLECFGTHIAESEVRTITADLLADKLNNAAGNALYKYLYVAPKLTSLTRRG